MHSEGVETPSDELKSRRLRFAVLLTTVVLVAELLGGLWTGSLALLSDAGHVFSDVLSLALSLLALRLAMRPPTAHHSFGMHRSEVLAALANGLALLAVCFLIWREAWERFSAPPEVKSLEMLAVAVLGLAANWVVLTRLGGHAHTDINLRSAYLHVLGDLLASIGVVIGAALIWATGLYVLDPIISAGIGLLILVGALRVTGEALHILLEGVPRSISLREVEAAIVEVPQVDCIHDVHAWTVCSSILAFSAHVVTCPGTEAQRAQIRRQIEDLLRERFGFRLTTLQLECEACDEDELAARLRHGSAEHANHNHDHHDHDHPEHGE